MQSESETQILSSGSYENQIVVGVVSRIQGTFDSQAAALKHMSIDHGCFYIFVSEQFLDRADVISGFKEMRRKAMAEDMRRNGLVYLDKPRSAFYGFL